MRLRDVCILKGLIAVASPTAADRPVVLLTVGTASGAVILLAILVGAARSRRRGSTVS